MKNLLILLSFTILINITIGFSANAGTIQDQYAGYLKHNQIGKEQFAKLEIIKSRSSDNTLLLSAILTLYFGGYESDEYISYHYHGVNYNILSNKVIFSQADQELTIVSKQVDDKKFIADVTSSVSGFVGELVLTTDMSEKPSGAIIEPLSGEYSGYCDGKYQLLQINTFRSPKDTTRVGNPFGSYEIRAHSGTNDRGTCSSISGYCVTAKYDTGSYNFFKSFLKLNASNDSLSCQVEEGGLNCGSCSLKRVSSEMVEIKTGPISTGHANFQNVDNQGLAISGATDSIKGDYYGYIYHDRLGKYQKSKLNIDTFQVISDDGSSLKISATANLFFGDEESNEQLSYRFDPTEYPNVIASPQFILARPEADVDAMLKINHIGNGIVKGVWYSLLYGRVGEFEMKKEGYSKLSDDTKLIKGLNAEYYEGDNGNFVARIYPILNKTPINTENPFYPMDLQGYIWHKRGVIKKLLISSGSYDFYSGKLAFLYAFDEDELLMVGKVKDNGDITLRRSGAGFGSMMQSFNFKDYNRN